MPLYSEDTATRSFLPLSDIPSTFSEVINAQFGETVTELPSVAGKRLTELAIARSTGAKLSLGDAQSRIDAAGLAGKLTAQEGITDSALDLIIERKKDELQRQATLARAEGGTGQAAARLGVALGTSLLDPVNVGLAFVPVVGEARYARILGKAGTSVVARAGVRAGVGALEGAAGAAIAEPLIYTAKQQEQADYEMTDSLMNLAFGTLFGGGLHVAAGGGADVYRAMRSRGAVPIDAPEAAAELRGESLIPRADELPAPERAMETRFAKRIEDDVDGAIAEYRAVDGADGGRVLNTDLARELSPDYRVDRTRSSAVHEPASYLVKRMYERELAKPPGPDQDALVLFSAGGTGAGKSTALEALAGPTARRAQIIYDTNMNTLDSAVRRIEQALHAGKEVQIAYVWRDPVDALVNGALPRAMRMGRTVPIGEHAKTHVGAAKVVKQLAELYKGDERVSLQVLDNSHGKGNARLGSIESIPDLEYNRVREDLNAALEATHRSGAISDAVYRGTKGKDAAGAGPRSPQQPNRPGAGRQPESQDAGQVTLSAADRAAAASPQVREAALRTAVGQFGDSRPVNVEPLFAGDDQAIAQTSARVATAPDPTVARQVEAAKAIDEEIAQSSTALETAEEDAAVAEAMLADQSKFLDRDTSNDPEMKAAAALAKKNASLARAAELATNCLIRGD